MIVLVTGATGWIARHLIPLLQEKGQYVVALSHSVPQAKELYKESVPVIGMEQVSGRTYDVVINLAGAGVLDWPWTPSRIETLYESRIGFTKKLNAQLALCSVPPKFLINASAVGFYGTQTQPLDESSSWMPGAAHDLCSAWEEAACSGPIKNVALLRFGVVLEKDGGMLAKLLPLFRWGLGAQLGSGAQMFSWIHRHDLLKAILFIMGLEEGGVWNLTAKKAVSHKEFCQKLARVLKGICWFRVPETLIRIFYQKGAELLVEGQNVLPKRLLDRGFEFEFEDLDDALEEICS